LSRKNSRLLLHYLSVRASILYLRKNDIAILTEENHMKRAARD